MNDEKLTQAAQQLGARAAERLDVQATARRVIERLREQPARRTVWMHQTWLRIAAAVVILVGGAFALRQMWTGASPDHDTHLIADDLRDLSTDELRAVLTSFDEIIDESVVPDSASDLQDLDARALRQLLREG